DGDLSEEERAVNIRRQQDVVDRQQRDRERCRGPKQIVEIGYGCESPFVAVQPNDEINQGRIGQKKRQEFFKTVQPLIERGALEAQKKREKDCRRGGNKIVQDDQNLPRRHFKRHV